MGIGGHSADGMGTVGPRFAIYRAVWRVFCGVLVVLGLVSCALALPAEIMELTVLIALVAATMAASFYGSGDRTEGARWTRKQVVVASAVGSAATILVVGLTVELGSSVLWLTLLVAAGSPPAVQWYRGRLHLGTEQVRTDAPERSTADLCRQWRESYEALRCAKTDRQRLRIVMQRQYCLDELGRRDPEGLEAWLSTSASAAGDPTRFLKHQ